MENRHLIYKVRAGWVEMRFPSGYIALIDAEDYPIVSQYPWSAHKVKTRLGQLYVYSGARKDRQQIALHRLIMNAPPGVDVDHSERPRFSVSLRVLISRNRRQHEVSGSLCGEG